MVLSFALIQIMTRDAAEMLDGQMYIYFYIRIKCQLKLQCYAKAQKVAMCHFLIMNALVMV